MRRSALTAVLAATALVTPLAGAQAAGPVTTAATAAASTAGVVASSSSSSGGSSPRALVDGDVPRRALGAEWSAAPADSTPWVQLTWPEARSIASVQVFGSTADAADPAQSTAAALYGTLRFSDGSSVVVSGIAPGAGMPTTVAFTPRATTSVRLELRRQIGSAPLALRELTAYAASSTPPRWDAPSSSPSYTATPPAARCSEGAPPVAAPLAGRLTLACPTPGSTTGDTASVVVDAPPGTPLAVWTTPASSSARQVPLRRVTTATADASGRAVLTADVSALPRGPFALKVTATGGGPQLAPLYVQLVKDSGAVADRGAGSYAPAGMTLQYDDDFSAPLSVGESGWDAQYAAVKPEPWGGSQFGDAVFADPAWGAGTLATLPGGFLRIRAQDVGAYASHQTWGQRHVSGILSSQRWGGSGFSAQHGYFEARILGAPGPGAWPAFWMMNSESGTGRSGADEGEVDAVEMYGHDAGYVCHSTHAWNPGGDEGGRLTCPRTGGDWAAQWHTYGVRVLDGSAEYYLDGRKVATLDQLSHTDQPFFFMLDLATGGGWPVDLAATGQTTDLYVDWVRVYT